MPDIPIRSPRRARRPRPTIRPERILAERIGGSIVAGVDEAGRGPIAGPVVAAAVAWEPTARRPAGINDSKIVAAPLRARLACQIKSRCLAWGIGICHADEIDAINILEATRLASCRAVRELESRLAGKGEARPVGALVTDALEIPALRLPTLSLVKGDQKSASVAAASILAKTTRDAMMDIYAEEFPGYGWESNRGYPTEEHYGALMTLGPTTLHRMTFRGVGFFCESPRHSRTFDYLLRRVMRTAEGEGTREAVEAEIEAASHRVPPVEIQKLRDLLAREVGLAEEPPQRP